MSCIGPIVEAVYAEIAGYISLVNKNIDRRMQIVVEIKLPYSGEYYSLTDRAWNFQQTSGDVRLGEARSYISSNSRAMTYLKVLNNKLENVQQSNLDFEVLDIAMYGNSKGYQR